TVPRGDAGAARPARLRTGRNAGVHTPHEGLLPQTVGLGVEGRGRTAGLPDVEVVHRCRLHRASPLNAEATRSPTWGTTRSTPAAVLVHSRAEPRFRLHDGHP